MLNHREISGKNKWSKIGFFLSLLCAIHCASTPLLLAILPLMGSHFLHNQSLELFLIGTTILLAGIIMLRDYLHTHKHALPLILLVLGIVAKSLGIFVFQHTYEPVIITSGTAFILLAYVANWRLRGTHQAACKC